MLLINSTFLDPAILGTTFCTIVSFVVIYKIRNNLRDEEKLLRYNKDTSGQDGIKKSIEGYETLFEGARETVGTTSKLESIQNRRSEYKNMVDSFYNLVTNFYEWGWGQSFHFAPRLKGESFEHSITRSEYYLAHRAGIKPNDKVLDVGCGIGGPLRNICEFTGANITGVTINEFQVCVGNQYNEDKGLAKKCKIIQGDFQKLDSYLEPESFDSAFSIEAACHSPDRVECFSSVYRCLKKGGVFVGYDWVVLPKYDETNVDHVRLKEGIEVGNSLPTLATQSEIIQALNDSGFEIIDSYDANQSMLSPYEIPWYQSLKGSWNFRGFRMTRLGRMFTHLLVTVLEFMKIAPSGSTRVSSLLNATALDIVDAGKQQIFSPSFFFLAKKR